MSADIRSARNARDDARFDAFLAYALDRREQAYAAAVARADVAYLIARYLLYVDHGPDGREEDA